MKIKTKIIISVLAILLQFHGISSGFAQNQALQALTRAEVVSKVVAAFNLKQRNEVFISKCLAAPNDCFFAFSAMSGFDGIGFQPLRLYPDVSYASTYAEDIHIATMLGIVRGYLGEKNMPFKPNANMSRVEALKVVLTAANLVPWKEQFEFNGGAKSETCAQQAVLNDILPKNERAWWYDRYVCFALNAGIIDAAEKFHPNEALTALDLDEMMRRTQFFQKGR